jgi:hypothetical protein
MGLIHSENRAGKPVKVADYHLIPIEQMKQIQPPGRWGILVWQHPAAVVVQHPDAPDEVIKIQDPTRQAHIFLLSLGLVVSIILLLLTGQSDERSNENV